MYITAADLGELMSARSLIELSNDQSRATDADMAVLEQACRYAGEVADGYLRSRYVLPLAETPTMLRNICLQIARYWLYSRRPEGRGLPEPVKEGYAQALRDLAAVAASRLHLGIASAPADDTLDDAARFVARASAKLDLGGY